MKPIFRNSMFGFHKEDVTRFIAAQSKIQEKIVSDMKNERDELIREYEEKISSFQLDAEEFSRLRLQEEKMQSLLNEFKQIEVSGSEIISRVNSQLEEKDQEVSELEKFNSELISRLEEECAYREKAKRFDQLTSVLSGIVNGRPLDSSDAAVEDSAPDSIEPLSPVDFSKLREDVDEMISLYRRIMKLILEFSEK